MAKLAAPMVARATRDGRTASPFNEGISVPQKDRDAAVKRNPDLESKNASCRTAAVRKEVLGGELAKYRRR